MSDTTDELIHIGVLYPDDLVDNRARRISERQNRWLKFRFGLWIGLAAIQVLILGAYIFVEILYFRTGVMAVFVCALLLVVVYTSVNHSLPYWHDLQFQKVRSVSGRPHKRFSRYSVSKGAYIGHCSLRVDDQTFTVNPAVYASLSENESYRVYYTSNSHLILNIEPL